MYYTVSFCRSLSVKYMSISSEMICQQNSDVKCIFCGARSGWLRWLCWLVTKTQFPCLCSWICSVSSDRKIHQNILKACQSLDEFWILSFYTSVPRGSILWATVFLLERWQISNIKKETRYEWCFCSNFVLSISTSYLQKGPSLTSARI